MPRSGGPSASKVPRQDTSFLSFPDELWVNVAKNLAPKAVGSLSCVNKQLAALTDLCLEEHCCYSWPEYASIARQLRGMPWRQRVAAVEAHAAELASLPRAVVKQPAVLPKHRAILVEWLAEVNWAWKLDSSIFFSAVSLLDHYLCGVVVKQLGMFQLIGICCLRVAMMRAHTKVPEERLQAHHFSGITADSYSQEQVEVQTTQIQNLLGPSTSPQPSNSKHWLRLVWFRLCEALIPESCMHVYSCASFLLSVGQMDQAFSALAPTKQALAAMLQACSAFGYSCAWEAALQGRYCYTLAELQPVMAQLAQLQQRLAAEFMRPMWLDIWSGRSYPDHGEAWQHLTQLVSHRSAWRNCPVPPLMLKQPQQPQQTKALTAAAATQSELAAVDAAAPASALPVAAAAGGHHAPRPNAGPAPAGNGAAVQPLALHAGCSTDQHQHQQLLLQGHSTGSQAGQQHSARVRSSTPAADEFKPAVKGCAAGGRAGQEERRVLQGSDSSDSSDSRLHERSC